MPIDITCPTCTASYKVPDDVAGKKIRCPKCNDAIIEVPDSGNGFENDGATGSASGVGSATNGGNDEPTMQSSRESNPANTSGSASGGSSSDTWQVKTPSGEIYGPVDRTELEQWVAEGRVNTQTQLMQSHSQVWQSAAIVFPNLANLTSAGQAAETGYQQNKPVYGNPGMSSPTARPANANTVSILLTVGGGIAILVGLLVLVGSGCVFCWTIYNLVAGILALVFGISSFSKNQGMHGKLVAAAIMLIICIIGCDVVSMTLGIVAMVLLSDEQTKMYFS